MVFLEQKILSDVYPLVDYSITCDVLDFFLTMQRNEFLVMLDKFLHYWLVPSDFIFYIIKKLNL